jgi:hypothetical protein
LAGEYFGTPRDVLVISPEDGIEDVFTPRLRAAGANLDRVHFVQARTALDGADSEVIIPRDLHLIGAAVSQYGAVMVWIDSMVTTLPDELKSISYKDVAKAIRAISGWASAARVAVAAPWHLNKTGGSDTALRIMDSRAFRTAVRSMLLVVSDPDAPEGVAQGIVALDKANAGTVNVLALRYRLRSAPYTVEEVDSTSGEVRDVMTSCGVVDWLDEIQGDGRAIARAALIPHIEKADSPEAWLRGYLTEHGEGLRRDVINAAGEDGFSDSAMKRASRRIGVVSREEKGRDPVTGYPWRRAFWSLGASRVDSHPTGPTYATGESSSDLIDLFYAVTSSRVSRVSRIRVDPTGNWVTRLGWTVGAAGQTPLDGRTVLPTRTPPARSADVASPRCAPPTARRRASPARPRHERPSPFVDQDAGMLCLGSGYHAGRDRSRGRQPRVLDPRPELRQDWRRLDGGSELKSQCLKRPLLTGAERQLIGVVGSGHGDPAVRQHARTLEGNLHERGPRDGHVTVPHAPLEARMTLVVRDRAGLRPGQREPCSLAPRVNTKCLLVALNVDHVPGYFHVRSVAGMRHPCLNRAAPAAQSR